MNDVPDADMITTGKKNSSPVTEAKSVCCLYRNKRTVFLIVRRKIIVSKNFTKLSLAYTALVTLPERRQRVQTLTRFGLPLTIAFTLTTFGFHVLFERLCE